MDNGKIADDDDIYDADSIDENVISIVGTHSSESHAFLHSFNTSSSGYYLPLYVLPSICLL